MILKLWRWTLSRKAHKFLSLLVSVLLMKEVNKGHKNWKKMGDELPADTSYARLRMGKSIAESTAGFRSFFHCLRMLFFPFNLINLPSRDGDLPWNYSESFELDSTSQKDTIGSYMYRHWVHFLFILRPGKFSIFFLQNFAFSHSIWNQNFYFHFKNQIFFWRAFKTRPST